MLVSGQVIVLLQPRLCHWLRLLSDWLHTMTAATGSHDLVCSFIKCFSLTNGSDLRQLFFRLKPARASSGDLFLTRMPVELVNTQELSLCLYKAVFIEEL